MPNLEVDSGTEQVQGHGGNLVDMLGPIADGKSTSHHVSTSNGFNLKIKQENLFSMKEAVGEGGDGVGGQVFSFLIPALRQHIGGFTLADLHPIQVPAFLQVHILILAGDLAQW